MLQELDARGNARTGDMPLEVKPVAPQAARRPGRRIAAITAALLAVALGATAMLLLPIKGKTFDPRPPVPAAPSVAAPPPASADPVPANVAGVAPAPSAPASAAGQDQEPAPPAAVVDEPAQGVAERPARAAAAAQRVASAVAAAPAAAAASTTTWAVASARARAEEARLAQRWAAEEERIAALPRGERGAAERRLRAEKDKAAGKARTDAAWIAALKRKEIAAGTFPGEAADSRPAAGQGQGQGRSETAAQRADNGYRRALASLQEGRVGEAIAGLQGALRINPKHDAARQTLVGLLIENRRSDEAMAELQQALALDARQPAMAMLLARLQIERGGSGIETLLRTLPYASGNGEYHAFLAGALQRQGRQREAADQYQNALRSEPRNAVWWMGLGISLQAEKRNAEALDAFQKAKGSGTLSQELQGFVERRIAQLAR